MGHGAGGGVESKDIQTAREVALEAGISVALVEQPYRVAGRRSPAPAKQMDTRVDRGRRTPEGGRARGARADRGRPLARCSGGVPDGRPLAAVAVLCVAFPLQPPQRKGKPLAPDRLGELEACRCDAGGAGRERPVRDPARGPEPQGRAGARDPHPAPYGPDRRGGARLARGTDEWRPSRGSLPVNEKEEEATCSRTRRPSAATR